MSALSHRSHQAALAPSSPRSRWPPSRPSPARDPPSRTACPPHPVNARGTDVAAARPAGAATVVNARGTDVAAADQQAPIVDNPVPVSSADRPDDSLPTPLLLALIALGLTLAGLGLASRVTATRRRTRAAA